MTGPRNLILTRHDWPIGAGRMPGASPTSVPLGGKGGRLASIVAPMPRHRRLRWECGPTAHGRVEIVRVTILSINQHDLPASWYDELEYEAGRSIAAGLGRLTPAGSAAALTDVRSGSTPGDLAPVYGAGASKAPEAKSGTRGRERAIVEAPAKRAAPEPASVLPSRAEAGWLDAIITSSTSIGTNRWSYHWSEAKWDGAGIVAVSGGKSSATHGLARNMVEAGNDGVGAESGGWLSDDPVSPVTILPLAAGTAVRLTGPRKFEGDATWFFQATNPVAAGQPAFRVRIVEAIAMDAGADPAARWLYEWEEVEHNGESGWVPKIGGRTSEDTVQVVFTAQPLAETVTAASSLSHLPDGAGVEVSTTTTLPAPLVAGTTYYGRWTSQGSGPYTLYPTRADALASTSAINITSAGTGTHTLTAPAAHAGKARNFNEHDHGPTAPGTYAPGYNVSTIPAGWSLRPISTGRIVRVEGPYWELDADDELVPRRYFEVENAIDGECEGEAP